ncbi:hypothetical protein [Burkholderia sp. S171]|uniref:hypothetical protein n=1 Tax=Burkholderia sp. S171 TaxID=1641860 RepID=UPI0020B1486C|nr:hypothetical protein [Burkholderia sp. S171]
MAFIKFESKITNQLCAVNQARCHLGAVASVYKCYEAGRNGFLLHRWLTEQGIVNLVMDSASIEVNRRARRAKTDRLDSDKLQSMLMRYYAASGASVRAVARIPKPEQEDDRRRTATSNGCIKSVQRTRSYRAPTVRRHFMEKADGVCVDSVSFFPRQGGPTCHRDADGADLRAGLHGLLVRVPIGSQRAWSTGSDKGGDCDAVRTRGARRRRRACSGGARQANGEVRTGTSCEQDKSGRFPLQAKVSG